MNISVVETNPVLVVSGYVLMASIELMLFLVAFKHMRSGEKVLAAFGVALTVGMTLVLWQDISGHAWATIFACLGLIAATRPALKAIERT